jgi:ABC-2 type transport system ATP-binding protein
MAVIEVEGLRKEYHAASGRVSVAVDGLDLSVPAGGVFGFLGPNGSGKTTTIRCLLGLVRPTAGALHLLGADVRHDLGTVMPRVGSVVETPLLFPNFSGRRNLELLARVDGISRRRVADMLERVGLAGRERDLVRTYSLGMRQRLGLAAALLKDPALLILDEPANGLDPAGIVEIRELVRSIGAEGRTVFVSSHLLGEVQQMCDRVAILARGKLITQGAVDEVLARGHRGGLVVRVDELERAAQVLRAAGLDATLVDHSIHVMPAPDDAAQVSEVLAKAQLYVRELRPDAVDLETVFLELTGGQRGEVTR